MKLMLQQVDPWKYPLLLLVILSLTFSVLAFTANMTSRSASDFKVGLNDKIKAVEHHENMNKQDRRAAKVKAKVPAHLGSKRALMQLTGDINVDTDVQTGQVFVHFATKDRTLTHVVDLDVANDSELQKQVNFTYLTTNPGDVSVTYEANVPVRNVSVDNMHLEGTYVKH